MNKITRFCLCTALIGAMSTVSTAQIKPKRFDNVTPVLQSVSKISKKDAIAKLKAASENTTTKWVYTTEKGYGYEDGAWVFDTSYENIKYDERGNKISERYTDFEGFYTQYVYENDAYGQKISSYAEVLDELNGNKPTTKGNYEWDPVVHDFCLLKQNWEYSSGSWVENSSNYKRTVTRDEKGNVTSFVVSMYYIDTYEDIERTDITYNETTGQAETYTFSRLTYSVNNGLFWSVQQEAKDIEWENTNGQLVREWQSFLMGDNRMKKAAIFYNGKADGYEIATYEAGKPDYTLEETDLDGVVWILNKYTTLDANGSYRVTKEQYDWTDGEKTVAFASRTDVMYNEKGNMTLLEYYETDETGVETLISGERYVYKYDDATGVMLESVLEINENDSYEPFFKIEYSDLAQIEVLGVEDLNVTDTAPVEYYNLQGVRVTNPTHGIFIRRQAGHTTKVVL